MVLPSENLCDLNKPRTFDVRRKRSHLPHSMVIRKKETDMKIIRRQDDGVIIVDISGKITLGEKGTMLRNTIQDLLDEGHKKVLLNLGDVTYIDSAGLGELISAFTSVRNRGGELKLLNLTKRVNDVLQITKLYTVFDVKDDEAAAVGAFK